MATTIVVAVFFIGLRNSNLKPHNQQQYGIIKRSQHGRKRLEICKRLFGYRLG
jgi:hypothetical protein